MPTVYLCFHTVLSFLNDEHHVTQGLMNITRRGQKETTNLQSHLVALEFVKRSLDVALYRSGGDYNVAEIDGYLYK